MNRRQRRAMRGSRQPKPPEPDPAMARALEHHRAGRLAEADAIYRAILKARPNDADALYLQGLAAYQQGDPEIAMRHVRNALVQRPDWPQAHYNLGNMLR